MNQSDEKIYFSVVVLCYRSERGLIPFVERLHHMLSLFRFSWEIILVGNYLEGAKDETPQVVRELETRLSNTRSLTLPKKGMMGWDMRSGLEIARGKYVGVIDGDGQFPLESIISCLVKIEAEDLDLVKTYRVRREDGVYRKLISKIFNATFKILFNSEFKDVNSKPKIFLGSKLANMNLQSDDWFVDAEIMLRAKEMGFKIGEIPIHFYDISGRASFVKMAAIFEFIKHLLQYRFSKAVPLEKKSSI